MRWEHETWRKLYIRVSSTWACLPLVARGIGSELLKYADDNGRIKIGDRSYTDELCRLMQAHTSERRTVKLALAALVADGYLTLETNSVVIKNYVEAQDRTPAAKRAAARREASRSGAPRLEMVATRCRDDRETIATEDRERVDTMATEDRAVVEIQASVENHSCERVKSSELVAASVPKKFAGSRSDPVSTPPEGANVVAPTLFVLEPVKSPKPPRTPKPPRPKTPLDQLNADAWGEWRTTYAASRRAYGAYTTTPPDGPRMRKLVDEAVANASAVGRPTEALDLLKHWFKSYLRDDGRPGFNLAELRHPLKNLEFSIPTYGNPWTTRQASAGTETHPDDILAELERRSSL